MNTEFRNKILNRYVEHAEQETTQEQQAFLQARENVDYAYPKEHFKYNIMKDKAFTLNEATKMLIAYEQLNDNEDVKYHLQEVDLLLGLGQEKPLVLKDEVKGNDFISLGNEYIS